MIDRVAPNKGAWLTSNWTKSVFLVDSRLCHSISIAIGKKFIGLESHTFSTKEQNGRIFQIIERKIIKIAFSSLLLSSDRLQNVS